MRLHPDPRRAAAALAVVLISGGLTSPAARADAALGQQIAGTTASGLSVSVPTTAAITGITPGATATGTALLVIVSTSPWTLGVADAATGATAGHLTAGGAANCAGSEAMLANPLSVTVTGLGVSSAGPVALSATNRTVASGIAVASLTATAAYSVAIGPAEILTTGCTYGLTATYTLQG